MISVGDQSIVSCFHPPNGTVISTFEGNNSTITCNFSVGDTCSSKPITTTWSVLCSNSNNVSVLPQSHHLSSGTNGNKEYDNLLTLYNMSQILDEAIIFCGTSSDKQLASFPVRVYSKF